jgi:hypothetical protein
MRIAGEYSFANGAEIVKDQFGDLLTEVENAIGSIDAESHRTKVSKEKTMLGRMLISPTDLNKEFKKTLEPQGWKNHKENCEYPTSYYVNGYLPEVINAQSPYRDMDFVKNRLGVEVQFGKYAFMVYNVAAKMTIFRNFGIIDAGIEIVPVKEFANQMSSGVSCFEQFCWDLDKRGVSDIDTPVLILGISFD